MSAIDPLTATLSSIDRPVRPRPEFADLLLSRLLEELGAGAQPQARTPWWARLSGRRSSRGTIKRPRSALVLVGLIMLAFVLVAAAAYALGHPLIDFSSAPHAPQPVVKQFSSLSVDAPPGMDPRVKASETRIVGKIERHTLWVAPSDGGHFCYIWAKASGGCEQDIFNRLSVSWGTGLTLPSSQPVIRIVEGYARSRWADEVEIELDDHSTVHPQMLWVSAPIDAGFYYYRAPPGRAIEAVTALRDGKVVAHDEAPPLY